MRDALKCSLHYKISTFKDYGPTVEEEIPFHFFTGCHKCVSLIYLDATEHTEVGRKFFHASFPAREHLDDSGPPLWLMVSSLSKCV